MSEEVDQLHAVLESCLGFAKQMLQDSGTFYPFGAVIDRDGELTQVGFWNGQDHPNPSEIYSVGIEALREKARSGEIAAGALAVDVTIPPQYQPEYSDGIRIKIERPGYSRFVYVPYAEVKGGIFRKAKSYRYGEAIPVDAPPELFLSAPAH